jgi:hypothetical protein
MGDESPEGEYRYSSTLCLTSALDGGWVLGARGGGLLLLIDLFVNMSLVFNFKICLLAEEGGGGGSTLMAST